MDIRQAPLVVMLVSAVLMASCSSSPAAAPPQVQSLEGLIDGGFEVLPDVTGTSATLRVDTSAPLACSVVFGVDESFGGIATDDDMGGGAHTDHAAVMRGLTPETTYVYRVQGTDARGVLYASDVMQFTTPPASEVVRPGADIAGSATIAEVSSEFSASFAAAYAIDGDPATGWSSRGDGDDASLTLDLGRVVDIVGVGVRSRSMGDGTAIINTFTVAVDGEVFGPFDAGTGELVIVEFVTAGTLLRFDAVQTTGGNTGLVDFEVYEKP